MATTAAISASLVASRLRPAAASPKASRRCQSEGFPTLLLLFKDTIDEHLVLGFLRIQDAPDLLSQIGCHAGEWAEISALVVVAGRDLRPAFVIAVAHGVAATEQARDYRRLGMSGVVSLLDRVLLIDSGDEGFVRFPTLLDQPIKVRRWGARRCGGSGRAMVVATTADIAVMKSRRVVLIAMAFDMGLFLLIG